jgi:hypothetical protein
MKVEISIYDVCKCGDYRRQHGPTGKCGVCGDGTYPDGCKRFRFAHAVEATKIHGQIESLDGHERTFGAASLRQEGGE